jgi:hypothetical protein
LPSSLTQLLAKLLDNVNLGKILVDGGPGVLFALAILLLACHSIRESTTVTQQTTTKTQQILPLEISHCTANDDIDKNDFENLPFLDLSCEAISIGQRNKLKNVRKSMPL